MVKLIPQSPFGDALPCSIDTATLQEVTYGSITWVAPFAGRQVAVEQAIGQKLPEPNRSVNDMLWVGPGQYLAFDKEITTDQAALTDQSDAFAILSVQGSSAEAILARLVPIDLRSASFGVGHTARTLINHMAASVTRTAEDAFELMVMRSMAGTLLEEVSEAAKHLSARDA